MTSYQRGLVAGAIDTLLWGSTVLYWPHLKPSSDSEILAQRLVWASVLMMILLALTGRLGAFRRLLADRRTALLLVGAALSITINWAGFIWGVNHDHVVDASLGLFINPLVTVLLAILVRREPVRPWQLAAVALAGVAVTVDAFAYGKMPWLALILALGGGLYGLFKKQADAGALESLALETAVVAPFALIFLIVDAAAGHSTFVSLGPGHALLLIGGGLVTVTPLIFFGYAASRVPLVFLGIIGYLGPVSTLVLALVVFREGLPASQLTGYVLVWTALVIFTVDLVIASRAPSGRVARGSPRRGSPLGKPTPRLRPQPSRSAGLPGSLPPSPARSPVALRPVPARPPISSRDGPG